MTKKNGTVLARARIWLLASGLWLSATGCFLLDEDLSLPDWGPYGVDQIGPTCILDREKGRAALFPVVVGQANGTKETRNLVFHRNFLGNLPGRMGTWKVLGWEANRALTYWSYRVLFRDTQARDWTVPNLPGWENGEAKVECARVPEGMLIAVKFINQDETVSHRYFADLLGGFDPYYQTLDPGGARVVKNAEEGWMSLEHAEADRVFACRARGGTLHFYDIRDSYIYPGVTWQTGGFGMHDDGTFPGDGKGWWFDLNVAEIEVGPGESRTVYFALAEAATRETALPAASALLLEAEDRLDAARRDYQETRYPVHNPLYGELMEHAVGQILINTVFYGKAPGDTPYAPARRRFFTPSRYYGVYHHWDAGCISLGLLEYDPLLAAENIDTALPDLDPAYFSLGLPPNPPTAIFALWELFQKTHELALLRYFYPSARQLYLDWLEKGREGDDDWLLDWQGEGPNGEPDQYGMGSGMDNLPVWEYAKTAGPGGTLRHLEAPCIQSLFIRCAKILRMMARALGGLEDHVAEYAFHIDQLGLELQQSMWNEEKGIFVPVWRDDNLPLQDYLDTVIGIYPLLAGRDIVSEDQKDRMIEYMTDTATLWSGFGIRTVSRAAPYYIPYIPWWGTVWPPYQWFVWKGLLGFGEVELARELAGQVLGNFLFNHTERPYLIETVHGDTGESIEVKDFTGLGSPVIGLYAAYNTPGRVSAGWDTQIHEAAYDAERDDLRFRVSAPDVSGPSGLVAVMGSPGFRYKVTAGAEPFDAVSDETGAVSFVADLGEEEVSVHLERSVP